MTDHMPKQWPEHTGKLSAKMIKELTVLHRELKALSQRLEVLEQMAHEANWCDVKGKLRETYLAISNAGSLMVDVHLGLTDRTMPVHRSESQESQEAQEGQ